MKRIIFFMIARNEGKIIERLLSSVENLVDAVCISENGPNGHSDDDMVDKIKKFCEEKKLPYKICSHIWKNFGHNRTKSFQEAKQFCKELKWKEEDTYGLTLDGDMKLEISDKFNKNSLTKPSYRVEQYNVINYVNVRLIRLDQNAECVGATHEYWKVDSSGFLETLRINDVGDGGCKSNKFERDIKLLTEELNENKNIDRNTFYLAQSYDCIGDNEKAVQYYLKRHDLGGFFEEKYMAMYRAGLVYLRMKNLDKFVECMNRCIMMNRNRIEPYYSMIKEFSLSNKTYLSYLLCREAVKLKDPGPIALFNEKTFYTMIHNQCAITGYYFDRNFGLEHMDLFIKKSDCDFKRFYENMIFYAENLQEQDLYETLEFKAENIEFESGLKQMRNCCNLINFKKGISFGVCEEPETKVIKFFTMKNKINKYSKPYKVSGKCVGIERLLGKVRVHLDNNKCVVLNDAEIKKMLIFNY